VQGTQVPAQEERKRERGGKGLGPRRHEEERREDSPGEGRCANVGPCEKAGPRSPEPELIDWANLATAASAARVERAVRSSSE
jgi:hypothetical protein